MIKLMNNYYTKLLQEQIFLDRIRFIITILSRPHSYSCCVKTSSLLLIACLTDAIHPDYFNQQFSIILLMLMIPTNLQMKSTFDAVQELEMHHNSVHHFSKLPCNSRLQNFCYLMLHIFCLWRKIMHFEPIKKWLLFKNLN